MMNCKKTEKCCLFFSAVAALLFNLVELSPVCHLMIMGAEFLTWLAAPMLLGHPKSVYLSSEVDLER